MHRVEYGEQTVHETKWNSDAFVFLLTAPNVNASRTQRLLELVRVGNWGSGSANEARGVERMRRRTRFQRRVDDGAPVQIGFEAIWAHEMRLIATTPADADSVRYVRDASRQA